MLQGYLVHKKVVRIHSFTVMIGWTGLTPWEFEFLFPGSLTSTFLAELRGQGLGIRVQGAGCGIARVEKP